MQQPVKSPANSLAIDEIVKSAATLSKKKIGALIAIEREIGLRPYIESGVPIDSRVSSEHCEILLEEHD